MRLAVVRLCPTCCRRGPLLQLLYLSPALLHERRVKVGHVEAGRDVRHDPEEAGAATSVRPHAQIAVREGLLLLLHLGRPDAPAAKVIQVTPLARAAGLDHLSG